MDIGGIYIKFLFYFFILQSHLCGGFLNFYLSLAEVHRLLGLEMELFYVRDGIINEYALYFVVPVASKIDALHFTWINTAGRSLPYSIKVDVSNNLALGASKLNISSTGSVPNTKQTFSISLPCSGLVTEEVNVVVQVNITFMPINVTSLTFRRKKMCIKTENHVNNHMAIDSAIAHSNSSNIFYTAVGCAITLIVIILSICSTSYYMKTKKFRNSNESTGQAHTTYLTSNSRNLTCTSSYGSFRRMPSYSLIDERSKDLQGRIDELTIQRYQIHLNSIILEGTFGRVYLGSCTNENGTEEEVIVKTVTDHASQTQISLLLQEGMLMYSLNHTSILSILGISIEEHNSPFLLYPYKNYKNMKVFLQKCKSNVEGLAHTLTTQEVVDMALQIVNAMQYLHKRHLLHKDLAARNCVIDDKLKVQIADSALSRDLFPSDYYCLGDNENRPVKWLAIESLIHKTFSTSSDVWSFGVLLWEFTTLAQQPYVEIDPFEMAAYLSDGYRLAQPVNCPDELFAVMAYCWAMSAEERPTFLQLQVCLQDFYDQLMRYV